MCFFSEIDTVRQLKQEATKKKQPTKKKEVKPMLMTSLIDALPIFTPNDVKNQSDSGKKAGKNSKVKSCLPKKKRKKQL